MTDKQTTDATLSPQNNHQRKRWLKRLTLGFLIIGFIYSFYWLVIGRFYETTDDAYVSGNLIEVMPQISGHVTAILADETDRVTKGQPLVTLDRADSYIALKNAESQLALTARQVSQLYKNADQLKSSLVVAEENMKKAEEDYHRRKGLVVNKTISEEDLRHAKIAFETSTASYDQAKSQLAAAVSLIGNTDLYHHPLIQQSEVNLRNAFLSWERTTIFAPENGYVAKRPVEVGQQVTPNTILMIIVPLDQIWVNANFKESQLRHFRINQPVELISDVYGSGITFKGSLIGINPGTGSAFDLLPPQNATGNWIKIVQRLPVRISVDPEQLKKYPLQIGLSMTATVNTRDRSGKRLTQLPQKKIVYQTKDYSSDLNKADQTIDQILNENAQNVSYSATP